jgi:hypothetical protein
MDADIINVLYELCGIATGVFGTLLFLRIVEPTKFKEMMKAIRTFKKKPPE